MVVRERHSHREGMQDMLWLPNYSVAKQTTTSKKTGIANRAMGEYCDRLIVTHAHMRVDICRG